MRRGELALTVRDIRYSHVRNLTKRRQVAHLPHYRHYMSDADRVDAGDEHVLRLLWSLTSYDGMATGICTLDGVPHYCAVITSIFHRGRLFALARLTDSQFAIEKAYSDARVRHTGTYECYFYDEQGRCRRGSRWPGLNIGKSYRSAYEKFKNMPHIDFNPLEVVGVWEYAD